MRQQCNEHSLVVGRKCATLNYGQHESSPRRGHQCTFTERTGDANIGINRFYAELTDLHYTTQESFRRGNAWERRSHCKCLRTHYGRHCEPFSGQKCTILQDFAYTREPPQKRLRCSDPDTNFRLVRQRSNCSDFTKRPLL